MTEIASNDGGGAAEHEQFQAGIQAGPVRAGIAGRAKALFGRSLTAATAVFVVTIATALLILAAPGQAGLIVACWLLLSVTVIAMALADR